MRIDELMMGDWVYDEVSLSRLRVEGIYKNGRAYLGDGDYGRIAAGKDISPIPMTEDVAIASGWKKIHEFMGMSTYLIEVKGTPVVTIYNESKEMISMRCGRREYPYRTGCVHQVQQGLRLEGFYELANSMKV